MAMALSKLKPSTYKAPIQQPIECFYIMGYAPNLGKPNPSPQMIIKGRWLE